MKNISAATIAVLVVVFSGCTTSLPQPEFYSLSSEMPLEVMPSKKLGGTVRILNFTAAAPFSEPFIAYRSDPYRLHYDRFRRWVGPPSELVQELVIDYLRESGLCEAFVTSDGALEAEYKLRGRVREFYELDAQEGMWAVCKLELCLSDRGGNSVISHVTRNKVEATRDKDLTGLAKAMSKAVRLSVESFLVEANRKFKPSTKGRDTE